MIAELLLFFSSLDDHLAALAQASPLLFFGVVTLIIFAETGLVVMLAVAGGFAAVHRGRDHRARRAQCASTSQIPCAAAILGDAVNYFVGSRLGMKAFERKDSRVFKQGISAADAGLLRKVRPVFDCDGRFVPIVRTFVPFLAGVAQMPYRTFFVYNVIGGVAWISSLTYAGHLFGNISWVRNNLSVIVIGIVAISVLPIVVKVWQEHRRSRRAS